MTLQEIKLTPLIDTLRLEKISDEIYFSEKYSGYVSNSRLGLINPRQDGSPERFFAGFSNIGYSQALSTGSAVHELCLQGSSFELCEDIGKPTAKLGAVADVLYPIYAERDITIEDVINASDKIDYYKGKIDNKRFNNIINSCSKYWKLRNDRELDLTQDKELIYLDAKTIETVKSCVNAVNSNSQMQELLHPTGLIEDPISENEQAILLDVKVECPNGKNFVLRLKSKLDNYTIDSDTICVNDLKTIGKIVSEFDNNIKKFHYSREIAMYLYLLRLCAIKFYNISNPKMKANYLVVSTIPNYYTKVRPVSYGEIQQGFHEFKTLLRYVAYNIAYNNYSLDGPKYQL